MELFPLQLSLDLVILLAAAVAILVVLTAWLARAALGRRLAQTEAELQAAGAELKIVEARLDSSRERETQLEGEVKRLREDLADKLQRLTRSQVLVEKNEAALKEQQALLEQTRRAMAEQFENLANRIFEEKQQVFVRRSEDSLRKSLDPLERQLGEFRKRVEHVYDRENAERNSLLGQIKALREQTQRISEEALNLTSALKGDRKIQGNWGEVVLERLLEESGLQKGREYETQVTITQDGRRRQPDVIVRLPENKDLIIDAKVSLVDYERYSAAETEEERARALKQHVNSLRAHITGLNKKAYEQLEGVRTLDFVFIFVPIEAAYMLAMQADPELFRFAYERQIVLVSPTSLMATLRTVENIWRYEKQNKNAEKIAEEAGKLHDQFAMVLESLDELGGRLRQAQDAYDQTYKRLATGRGNAVKRIDSLRKLGARTRKQIAAELRERAAAEEQAALPEPEADGG
ncbi:DNA recombination protein RmuC [Microbulbifer thermotolerans]|uniref:Recombinase RmuC n=1 Tax=Microbulbifer thermotolerans TaxID=252514 RepID=A0A143HLU4_MICTH|nr:DNA recombination protein RmuC [Microbulbifer thermotolerans]AMX02477.1 recombinase RmuC [Microbulbifer thermotolerans]MCX2782469.1 DNA recombination protein RmuC [Microbulbifer thermotolerans]MCX2831246.1 DNA recombination protein RmuC [Microbulbifer thermotolerans]MCX2833726.1 DNA recombination protein RmuC [Microbulbifer thermotolerans]SFB82125.1 DNA recombination protein RmuC [Microbulbifer thermotolerans]